MDPISNNLNNNPSNPSFIGNPETNTHDTQRFTNEGEISTTTLPSDITAKAQYGVVADKVSHEIADFCSRPYRLPDFTQWKTGSSLGTSILNFEVVDLIRKTPIWQKLIGFYAFSATFCIRITVNSQPTQAGALLVSFQPDERSDPTSKWGFWNRFPSPEFLLARKSGCPSTVLVVGSTSQTELRVAYRATAPLCKVQNGHFGNFDVAVLSKLLGPTNAETCSVRAYVWLENLQTYATAPYNPTALAYKQQAKEVKTKAPPSVKEAAQKVNHTGPVSSVAQGVSEIASALTAIPGVADIAGPVSWVASGVASVASLFGYSKPHDITPAASMVLNPYKDFAHGSGALAASTKLSFNDTQETKVRTLGPTEKDEMTLAYLIEKPIYLERFPWGTVSNMKDPLFSNPIGPQYLFRLASVGKMKFNMNTTLSYLSKMFRWWRGTIKFTFSIVGTKFHSGRLRIVYTPGSDYQIAAEQHQHTYAHVVDIRDSNTFTIAVPFVSIFPWRNTVRNETINPLTPNYEGSLSVYVEEPLVAHPSAAQEVDIVVFASGSDFAFAGPRISDEYIGNGYNPVPPKPKTLTTSVSYTQQGFTNDVSYDTPAVVNIVNDVAPDPGHLDALEQSVGDPIISLRSLAKRMNWQGGVALKKTDEKGNMEVPYVWSNRLSYVVPQLQATAQTVGHGDFIDWITALYRFRSGGMRYCFTGDFGTDASNYKWCPIEGPLRTTSLIETSQTGVGKLAMTVEQYRRAYNFTTVPYSPGITGGLQIEVPYYAYRPFLTNERRQFPQGADNLGDTLDAISSTEDIVLVNNFGPHDSIIEAYRSGADDFNCGFFCGPPLTFTFE